MNLPLPINLYPITHNNVPDAPTNGKQQTHNIDNITSNFICKIKIQIERQKGLQNSRNFQKLLHSVVLVYHDHWCHILHENSCG